METKDIKLKCNCGNTTMWKIEEEKFIICKCCNTAFTENLYGQYVELER